MKNIKFFLTLILMLVIFQQSFCQTPQYFKYQGICRDNSGAIIQNLPVDIRLSIHDMLPTGNIVYQEIFSVVTNEFGLIILNVGNGTVQSGIFASIPWELGDKYLEIEMNMGSGFINMGTTQLLSVPYALHAKTAETITGGVTETDPVFTLSPANGITSQDITYWFTAYGWGNHATSGYLTNYTETDPIFLAHPSNGINAGNISNWNTAFGWGNHASAGYLTNFTESDPIFLAHPANGISSTHITDWNTAFGWGNHASAGYLTSFTESDPVFGAHPSSGISTTNISNWNTSYNWGNHATVGYLTSFNETDPIFSISPANGITNPDISNWNNAFNWGNHATAGYLTNFSESDPIFGASPANGITNININNWNNAFSWGNHATAGYLTDFTETDPFFIASPANGITPLLINNWNNAYNWGNHASAGYLSTEVDGSVTNEIQTLSIIHDTIALSLNGGKIKLPIVVSSSHITNDTLYNNYSNGQITAVGYVGNGSPGSSLPTILTVSTTDISYTTTLVNSNIINNGNEFIISRGVCLSRNPIPDLNDTIYVSGIGSGNYSTTCNQLLPNTTYYVRAYATNTVGTSFGNELSFTTNAFTVPTITTKIISNITNTSAVSGGNISDDGGTPILSRGICWSLNPSPSITDNIITEGTGTGSYIALMTSLTSNTLYHVRAYATNAQGTSYGNDQMFTTIVLPLASVTTNATTLISYTSAKGIGVATNDNGSPITSRGICWATTPLPTTANSNYTEAGGLGNFTANITGLNTNTTYYVRAFAINGGGTSYGNQESFITLTTSLPTLTTKAISGISSNLAGSGGLITLDGGSAITAKGVCWSLNPTPTISNSKTTDGTGSASYNSTITGLNPLTLYYVRAYATNGLGTAYGDQVSFTTTDLVNPGPTVPIVGTSTSTLTGSSTASSGGYVSSDGGSTVTERGVCWSTSASPTLSNNFSTDGGSGLGFFSSTITGLSGCATIYYIRAYATNSTGTGYGNQNTVSTGLLPIVTTDDLTNISYYTAVSGGTITDDGGCPITQKGVCWSYNPSPTIGNSRTTEGAGSGPFVSNITGLYANRTYYVRAYATNSVGTVYGPEKVFTTATPSTLYIGQNYAGGIIFYIDGTGEHGLVCASADQGQYEWGCSGTSISTSTAMGTGAANTAAIVASCGTANIAAKICDNLVLNSYSDWFLPSKDELILMNTNLGSQGLGNFASASYYSSSESSSTGAWGYAFGYGYVSGPGKSGYPYYVRAVRAF